MSPTPDCITRFSDAEWIAFEAAWPNLKPFRDDIESRLTFYKARQWYEGEGSRKETEYIEHQRRRNKALRDFIVLQATLPYGWANKDGWTVSDHMRFSDMLMLYESELEAIDENARLDREDLEKEFGPPRRGVKADGNLEVLITALIRIWEQSGHAIHNAPTSQLAKFLTIAVAKVKPVDGADQVRGWIRKFQENSKRAKAPLDGWRQ